MPDRPVAVPAFKEKIHVFQIPQQKNGAGDGIRTHGFLLGKQTLYH